MDEGDSDCVCVVCGHIVSDECKAIMCEECDRWQHRHCKSGVTLAQYNRMVKGVIELPFVCVPCRERQSVEVMEVYLRDDSISESESDNESVPESDHETVPESGQETESESDQESEPESDMDTSVHVTVVRVSAVPMDTSVRVIEMPVSAVPMETNDDRSFRAEAPFEEPEDDLEQSMEDPSLSDSIVEPSPITYQVMQGASQRGKDLLVDSTGYTYNVKETNSSCIVWWCTVRNPTVRCPARVRQSANHFIAGNKDHVHPPDPSRKARITITKQANVDAGNDLFKSAMKIVDAISNRVVNSTDVEKPRPDYIARVVNRIREKTRPKDLRDMQFELKTDNLPEGFYRKEVKVGDRRHLIFATDEQLNFLKRSRRWYLDGTFKVVKAPFTSLLSIHAFVRRGDHAKQLPLVFVCMSGRRTQDYVRVLQAVGRMVGGDVVVDDFVVDFERGLWAAIREVFRGASIHGCSFHWGQAVWRNVVSKGLEPEYQQKKGTYAFIRKLLCLPYLPAEHIVPVFDTLVDLASEHVMPLMEYVRRTWLESDVWPVHSWSVYGRSVRTNNDVEGWHRCLNHKANDSCPPFYLLAKLLHDEAVTAVRNAELVSVMKLRRYQRARYATLQGKTFALWKSYRDGNLTSTGLLKAFSCLYKPSVSVTDAVE